MKYSLTAFALLGATAFADGFTVDCNGNDVPDYGDCDTIINAMKGRDDGQPFARATSNECYFPKPPSGTDPNSLNCIIAICFGSNITDEDNAYATPIDTDYIIVKDQCGGANAGGTFNDQTTKYSVSAKLNPSYNPKSKMKTRTPAQLERKHARELVARDGVCTDGSGNYKLLVTSQNVEKPGSEITVTGRLPNGSMYVVQQSDAKTIGVEVSVEVSAGFFDLFDASTTTTVSGSDTKTSTTGVTVNVDCEDGQDGTVYLYPLFTEYKGLCTSDNNKEIDVYVPSSPQSNYEARCLGSGSG